MKVSSIITLAIMLFGLSFSPTRSQAQETLIKVNSNIFPTPQEGYKRMIIEVPYSENDKNKKIEFSIGKMMEVDGCNHFGLNGNLEKKDLQGWGYSYYEFKTDGQVISTQMACPDATKRNLFVSAQPELVQYNGKMPIVIYVPQEYDVQFKIYSAGKETFRALEDKPQNK